LGNALWFGNRVQTFVTYGRMQHWNTWISLCTFKICASHIDNTYRVHSLRSLNEYCRCSDMIWLLPLLWYDMVIAAALIWYGYCRWLLPLLALYHHHIVNNYQYRSIVAAFAYIICTPENDSPIICLQTWTVRGKTRHHSRLNLICMP
jgi:hypothetical protein